MNHKPNIGVVGCGYWGPNLVRNFRGIPSCRLVRVCDLDEDRLAHMRSVFSGLDTTTDFDAMVQADDLDALVIATGARHHFPMAEAALRAGKHVLVEKPLTLSVAEAEKLQALAAKAGLVLMVGHTFLYSPAVNKVRELVAQGEIGDIRYISARRLNLGIFQKDINVVWDLAPHDISIILTLMGALPHTVHCHGGAHVTPGIEDIAVLNLEFSGGRSALIHTSWLDPRKVREMTIVGSRKMIVYDDVAQREKIRIHDARVERPPHFDSFADFHYAYHYGDVFIPYLKQDEPLRAECQHFVDCILSGDTPVTGAPEGLDVVRVLEAAQGSLRDGGRPRSLGTSPS